MAGPGDVALMVSFYQAAAAELSALRGGRALLGLHGRAEPLAASFAAQLADAGQLVVVGCQAAGGPAAGAKGGPSADVVGYGTCRTLPMLGGERLGLIEDLYVSPEHRRHGVGRAMAQILTAWCADQGCTGVDAWALPGSRAVKSFFESGRFKARVLVMHHKLPTVTT